MEEFLLHGLGYVFVPNRGEIRRGMPTLHAGPPLSQILVSSGAPPVWPPPEGNVRGQFFSPLYRSVPKAAGLLLTDPAALPVRARLDADAIVEVATLARYHWLSGKLRRLGFWELINTDLSYRLISYAAILQA